MPIPTADELRTRLGVGPDVADTQLDNALHVAAGLLNNHITVEQQGDPLAHEATLQLAVKVWDLQPRGTAGFDPLGDLVVPPASATAGLVKSVWAFVQALHPTGGLTV